MKSHAQLATDLIKPVMDQAFGFDQPYILIVFDVGREGELINTMTLGAPLNEDTIEMLAAALRRAPADLRRRLVAKIWSAESQ